MPFTLAHPAIILPILRSKNVSATGLIIGSMVPDVEYFINMGDHCENSHTLISVFLSYLPLGIFFALLFHLFIRDNLISNLPLFLQKKFGSFRHFNFIRYLRHYWYKFLYSLTLGILLHFMWDSFTHGTGVFAIFEEYYKMKITILKVEHILSLYLQYFSTAVGLIAVGMYIFQFEVKTEVEIREVNVVYWLLVGSIVSVIMFLRIEGNLQEFTPTNFVISSVSSFFVGFSIYGKIDKVKSLLLHLYTRHTIQLLKFKLVMISSVSLQRSVDHRDV